MQLDHDCLRSILLYLEDHTGIYREGHNQKYHFFEVGTTQLCNDPDLKEFGEDNVVYATLKLWEANMLTAHKLVESADGFYHIIVTDITWEGHEFLGNIRDNTTWERTKQQAKALGIASVKGIATLSWRLFLKQIDSI